MPSVVQITQRRKRRLQRRKAAQTQSRTWLVTIAVIFVIFGVLPLTGALGGAAVVYAQSVVGLPQPQDTIYLDPIIGPTRLYARDGQTLLFSVQDPLGDQRAWVTIDTLPSYLPLATLVMEDPDFLDTNRFDPLTTLIKLWDNIIAGPTSADPTITGRLVRNVIAPPGDYASSEDRLRETALIAEINRLYTPQQILEWHLNTNYYGNEAYGIEAAAQVYLGKSAADLSLDEAVLLAAIPPAPQYNPLDDLTAAQGRQRDLLRTMLASETITQEQYLQAPPTVTPIQIGAGQLPDIAPEFALFARRQAEDILNSLGQDGARLVSRGGLRITTTLDLDLYYQSDCALQIHLARLRGENPDSVAPDGRPCLSADYLPPAGTTPITTGSPDQGALVLVDVATGEIKSMIGSATEAIYQPGPTLYPFVYFEGFRKPPPLSAATMVLDIPKPFPGPFEGLIYTPTNPDGQFRGPMNLRDAMSIGLLPPVVQVAQSQGIDNVLRSAHQIGLNSLDEDARYDLSLLEAGGEVSVVDVAYAYTVFASMGEMRGVAVEPHGRGYRGRDPVAVLKIEDADGNVIWEYKADQPDCAAAENCTLILLPGLAYLVNNILADSETRWSVFGQNNILDLSRQAAVVNGLTSTKSDNWTAGYTPQMSISVHLGRSDGQPISLDVFGLQGAAPIWHAVTEYAHNRDGITPTNWQRPENIVEMAVCERSGLLPNDACPVRSEVFLEGTQPRLTDSYWRRVEINSETRQLATTNTPVGLRTEQVYFVPPVEALDWWQANNFPLPPDEYDTVTRPELFGSVRLLQPAPFAYVGGVVDIRGSLNANDMQFYQLAYGQGLNPSQWVDISGQQTTYVQGGSMGQWDTTSLDGLYNLRLTVVLTDNTRQFDVVQVTVDNQTPVITLNAGEPGRVYQWPREGEIALEAAVEDNLAINRVEFYHDGQFLGSDETWPYGFNWQIRGVGTENFNAVVFDAVGNNSAADLSVEIVRSQ